MNGRRRICVCIAAVVLTAIALASTGCHSPPPKDQLWHKVATADTIAIGRPYAPVFAIGLHRLPRLHDYVDIKIGSPDFLKEKGTKNLGSKSTYPSAKLEKTGNESRSNLMVHYYAPSMPEQPSFGRLVSRYGAKSIIFLTWVEDQFQSDYYFESADSLGGCNLAEIELVQKEIAKQADILSRYGEFEAKFKDDCYPHIKTLIDRTTNAVTQAEAFAELEGMGAKAVPSIILLMDDRRPLGRSEISLENHFQSFEGLRHYRPELAVDAMEAILNQITGESFGQIHNGGTERTRRNDVDGWRIFLYYWKVENNVRFWNGQTAR